MTREAAALAKARCLALALFAATGASSTAEPSQTRVEQLQLPPPGTAGEGPAPGAAHAAQASPRARNESDPGLETRLERRHARSPEASLYAQVAEVWQLIRRRGQQPTPERIAEEIGPENLTSFLNAFPGSENMFGVDSDKLPVAQPVAPPPGTP